MKKLLLVLLCFSFVNSNAQIVFEKGYFITNTGERTECYIKNLDWRFNPTEFEYKNNLDDLKSNTQTILTVQEFGINEVSKYKRFKINIERSSDNLKDLSQSKNPIWKEETIFLEFLVEGDASLFAYYDDNLFKYFYKTNTTPIEQLVKIKYYATNEDGINYGDITKENNLFRQQLYNSLKSPSLTLKDFEKLNYDKTSLVKLFVKFNSSLSYKYVNYTEKGKKGKYNIKASIGLDEGWLSIDDPNVYYNLSTDISGITVFKIGGEFEYIFPFSKNTWSIFINPMYLSFEKNQTFQYIAGVGNASYNKNSTVNIQYSNVEIPIGIRHYFFLNNNSKIFANVAYNYGFIGKTVVDYDKGEKTLNSSVRNNFSIGLGYSYNNKYSIEARLNTSKQILGDYISWSGTYSSFGLILGYNFL